MAVHLHDSLERVPGWREMADYADDNMPEHLEGYEIHIRPASEIEERRFLKDGDGSASVEFDEEQGRFGLVFSLSEVWSLGELRRLFQEADIPVSDASLLEMWMAQGNLSDPVAFAEAHVFALDPDLFGFDEDDEDPD